MSKSTRGFRAAGIASLAVSVSIGVAAPAFAVEGFTLERIGGEDRYETAALVADEYSATNDNVILANGQPGFYADALASNYLAGVLDAPILLTNMKQIPEYTLDQLDQMNAKTVTVVGGEGVVPPAQVEQLEDAGYTVERVAGDDRFETNADVIAEGGDATDGIGLIATGFDFPDALAAGPFAYQGHPLGLSTEDSVKDVVLDALEADGVTQVLIFGGESVVGQGAVEDLADRGITVLERFDGDDRSDTSQLAADWALENLDFVDTHVGVASGYTEGYGADALAGGPLEGKEMSPMLITRNVDNPDDALDYIAEHSDTLVDGHLYGGPGAVSVAAEAAMEEAGQGDAPASNQDFTVTPAGNQSDETGGTDVDYTITGIPAGTSTVDVSLVACEDVTVSNTGLATFEDDENTDADADLEGDNQADGVNEEDTPAYFTQSNGNATGNTTTEHLNDVAVINGSVTFSVNSAEVDCVRAVVFDDANDDNELNLDAQNQPTEAFAITGELQFTAPGAPTGPMDENVASVDKANNRFVGCELGDASADAGDQPGAGTGDDSAVDNTDCDTFTYDGNDRFYIGGNAPANQATLAEFEAALSTNDDVAGDYNANPELQSTFILYNEAPSEPTIDDSYLTEFEESTSVTLEITEPASGAPDSYNVYRFTGDCDAADFGANPNPYTLDGTATPENDGTTTYEVDGLSPNTKYCFVVTAVEDGDESAPSGEAEETTATENSTDTAGPISVDAEQTTSGGFANRLDAGDVLTVCFDEPLAAPNAGDRIEVQDDTSDFFGDSDVATLVNGQNATFALGTAPSTLVSENDDAAAACPGNQTLTITITGPVVDENQSSLESENVVNVPVSFTDSAGVTDVAGNEWDIADSTDVYADNEGAEPALD